MHVRTFLRAYARVYTYVSMCVRTSLNVERRLFHVKRRLCFVVFKNTFSKSKAMECLILKDKIGSLVLLLPVLD